MDPRRQGTSRRPGKSRRQGKTQPQGKAKKAARLASMRAKVKKDNTSAYAPYLFRPITAHKIVIKMWTFLQFRMGYISIVPNYHVTGEYHRMMPAYIHQNSILIVRELHS